MNFEIKNSSYEKPMDTIEKLTEIFKEFPGIGERGQEALQCVGHILTCILDSLAHVGFGAVAVSEHFGQDFTQRATCGQLFDGCGGIFAGPDHLLGLRSKLRRNDAGGSQAQCALDNQRQADHGKCEQEPDWPAGLGND